MGCIASFELSLVAPVVHDLIYRSGGRVALPDGEISTPDTIFSRKEADDQFLEFMTRANVAYWKRNSPICPFEDSARRLGSRRDS